MTILLFKYQWYLKEYILSYLDTHLEYIQQIILYLHAIGINENMFNI